MKHFIPLLALIASTGNAISATVPLNLNVSGGSFDVQRTFEISDLGEGKTESTFQFTDKAGKPYVFDVKYKPLPSNRSFPGNLDITVKDGQGNKLGYLFFAINGVDFLRQMGTFGLVVEIGGEPIDFHFTTPATQTAKKVKGEIEVAMLSDERLVMDILVPKFDFQMIRPVLVPPAGSGRRSQTYSLDSTPYEANYTILDLGEGSVEFQSNLLRKDDKGSHLMERIYFHANKLSVLREAMYAGKYFDAKDGVFKQVFYPAMGQTEPTPK